MASFEASFCMCPLTGKKHTYRLRKLALFHLEGPIGSQCHYPPMVVLLVFHLAMGPENTERRSASKLFIFEGKVLAYS